MRLYKPANIVIFADNRIEKDFNSLKDDNWVKKAILRAIADFKENAFCGERIKKELIPKVYIRKYSVFANENGITAMIVEYFDHKNYERRFGY
jgi:hypothetical protein